MILSVIDRPMTPSCSSLRDTSRASLNMNVRASSSFSRRMPYCVLVSIYLRTL